MTTRFPVSIFEGVLLGLAVSLVAGLLAIRIALRGNLLDVPGSEPHKQHSRAIPTAGGIALVFTLLVGWFLNRGGSGNLAKVLLPSLIIFGIGLADDIRSIRFWKKLVVEMLAAVLLIVLGGEAHVVESSVRTLPLLIARSADAVITILWLVGITNAFNFVDSMDGLATGLSVIVSLFFAFASLFAGQTLLAHLMAYLAGACMGLYLLNSAPARLFLGNSGALFMGFLMAEIALLYNPRIFPQLSSWYVPIMVLGLPLFDMILVITSRVRRGSPIYQADLRHTYHRLVAHGLEPGRAVLSMHVASIILGCLAFISLNQTPYVANAIFIGVCLTGLGLLFYLEHPESKPKD